MPCFANVPESAYHAMSPAQREFVEALIERGPEALIAVRAQLADALVCDDGAGWLIFGGQSGQACQIAAREPVRLNLIAQKAAPGPQGLYCALFWFHDNGMLQAIELLMSENEPLRCADLTAWLRLS